MSDTAHNRPGEHTAQKAPAAMTVSKKPATCGDWPNSASLSGTQPNISPLPSAISPIAVISPETA